MFYDSFEYNFLECILLRLSFNSSLDVKSQNMQGILGWW